MSATEFIWLVAGMGLATYLPRWLPISLLSGRTLPRWFMAWLDLLPVAILSALVAPALVTAGESRHLELWRPELLAAVPTFAFAVKTRSLGGTVVFGMLLYWLAGKVL